ncbi:DNA-binding domain-containing protein [Spirillospora sp. NPDC047418]
MGELAGIQSWMHAAILDPDGPAGDAARVVTASARLTARERLAIYWRGYRLRLLESMRGLHPGLVRLLGRDVFDGFALDYLDAHPPRAYTLFRLDEGFAAHLAETRPDGAEHWPDMIIDLARFERAVTEATEAPGTEDGVPPGTGLRAVPCLRLLRLTWPAHEYLAAVREGADPPLPAPRPVHLAVSRRDYALVVRELGPRPFAALDTLARGGAAGPVPAGWLRKWTGLGFLTRAERLGAAHDPAGPVPAPMERNTAR